MSASVKKIFIFVGMFSFILGIVPLTDAEPGDGAQVTTAELEGRVRELEDYVSDMHTNLKESYEQLQANLEEYKKSVDVSLQDYSKELQAGIEERLQDLDDRVVTLNLISKGYKKVETNSGILLISIQDVKRLNDGYRLVLHIGNPNFASYHGIKLRLRWGEKWEPGTTQSYLDWRKSLIGAEYQFNGKLDQGTWTEMSVDVSPATTKMLEHIECSMEADSVQLNLKNPKISLLHK